MGDCQSSHIVVEFSVGDGVGFVRGS